MEIEYNGKDCGQCNCLEIAEYKNGGPVKNMACLKPEENACKKFMNDNKVTPDLEKPEL